MFANVFARQLKSIGLATALVSIRSSCLNCHSRYFDIFCANIVKYFQLSTPHRGSNLLFGSRVRFPAFRSWKSASITDKPRSSVGLDFKLFSVFWLPPITCISLVCTAEYFRPAKKLTISFILLFFLCTKLKLNFVSTKKLASLSKTRKNCVKAFVYFPSNLKKMFVSKIANLGKN